MTNVLVINASLNGEQGNSNKLTEKFVNQWLAREPLQLVDRDLSALNLPHLSSVPSKINSLKPSTVISGG